MQESRRSLFRIRFTQFHFIGFGIITKTTMLFARFLLLVPFCAFVRSWETLGPANFPDGIIGKVVDMSEDGRRIALGAPHRHNGDGAVLIYELDNSGSVWNLLVQILGAPGEGFGDALSFSPDGRLVAVRRHHVDPNAVQVYKIYSSTSNTYHYHPLGPHVSCPANGKEVTLAQASIGRSPASPAYYLLVSCESYDGNRGLVQAFKLDHDGSNLDNSTASWTPFLPALTGASSGDLFGFATAIVETPSLLFPAVQSLRIAVSSPLYSSKRGMVQIFVAQENDVWSQLGEELVGAQQGERLGTSLAMSATTHAYIAIGSPKKRLDIDYNPRGMVQVFHWRTPTFGEPPSWQLVGTPQVGLTDRDSFGYDVAITRDGGRVAASSIAFDSSRGYVAVFERDSYDSWKLAGPRQLGGTHGDELGASLALNAEGSVVATVARREGAGSSGPAVALTWVDETPFCQLPLTAVYSQYNASVLDSYLDRLVCRDGMDIVSEKDSCETTHVFWDGNWEPCVWESRPFVIALVSSESPTIAPTSNSSLPFTSGPSASPHGPPSPPAGTFRPSFSDPLGEDTTAPIVDISTETPSEVSTNSTRPVTDNGPTVAPTGGNETEAPSNGPTTVPALFVRACSCNERSSCIWTPLIKGADLRLCIRVLNSGYDFVSIAQLFVQQEELLFVMINNNIQVTEEALEKVCDGSICTVSFPLSADLFLADRPHVVKVFGSVIMTPAIFPDQRRRVTAGGQPQVPVGFHTFVKLEDWLENQANSGEGGSSRMDERLRNMLTAVLWVSLGTLGLIALVAFFICIARESKAEANK